MSHRQRRNAIAGACAAAVATGLIPLATAQAQGQDRPVGNAEAGHVLLISVDGLHQSDLASYVSTHRQSALARLVDRGTSYTHAQTPVPSDSFPGMVAQVTGGNPGTTGVPPTHLRVHSEGESAPGDALLRDDHRSDAIRPTSMTARRATFGRPRLASRHARMSLT